MTLKIWKADEVKVIEDPRLVAEVERKLPWLIDVLLYPVSVSGIIHLAIFLLVPLLIKKFVFIDYYGIIHMMLYMMLIGYIFYYLAYCVFDSSKGGYRAPDISAQDIPDRGDLISQIFLMLGCVAICFCPVSVYYIFTERTDLLFWVLSAYGIFFLPMSFLGGIMFDSVNALNPILIIRSILNTFLPYCGLVLLFCAFSGSLVIILQRLPIWDFISKGIRIYLLFVLAHLLGRFYWRYQDKLNWEV